MDAWRSLIHRAIARLETVGLDRKDWVWGGGTVLMLRYGHRQSRDIDLFINDVQYLSYLSPRLNEADAEDLRGYAEAANHLRLEYPEGEVDFLTVAPVFPGEKPEPTRIEGVAGDVYLMSDREIIGQKLHYRAAGFTGRDLYDFATVARARPELLADQDLRTIALQRRDALAVSLASPNCELGYLAVDQPSLPTSFADARAALLDWIA
jgi:hypothetical protein